MPRDVSVARYCIQFLLMSPACFSPTEQVCVCLCACVGVCIVMMMIICCCRCIVRQQMEFSMLILIGCYFIISVCVCAFVHACIVVMMIICGRRCIVRQQMEFSMLILIGCYFIIWQVEFCRVTLGCLAWCHVTGQVFYDVCLFVDCLTSQQHASVSQGRICSDNSTCCHTEIEVTDPTFYLTKSQYTDTEPTGPSTDPITPGAWQGSHWSANF